jgi:hypothetical protein
MNLDDQDIDIKNGEHIYKGLKNDLDSRKKRDNL